MPAQSSSFTSTLRVQPTVQPTVEPTVEPPVECEHCREVNKYHPFPVGMSIFGFLLVMFIIILVYFQYYMVRKQSDMCEVLLTRHHL